MRFLKTNYIIGVLFLLFTTACGHDSDFDGIDNYITSFQLQAGNETISASIVDNKIEIMLSETFTKKEITAVYKLSEKATISPSPADIKDWTTDLKFVVNSFNGKTREYTFKAEIDYDNITKENVILLTQDDVDTFGALKMSAVKGNLTIGSTMGEDVITTLEPLSDLKVVDYELTINPSYKGEDLKGLDNLERIGSLNIVGENIEFTNVVLPNLKMVALDMSITNPYTALLDFPALKSIGNNFYLFNTTTSAMNFPVLEAIEGGLKFERIYNVNETIEFPTLKAIGGSIDISGIDDVLEITFPKLEETANISFSSLSSLTTISFPMLKTAGDFKAGNLYALESLKAPLLKELIELRLEYNYQLSELDFSSLQSVEKDLYLASLLIEDLTAFKSLESVGGYLSLSYMDKITTTSDMASLQKVKNLSLYNLKAFSEVDLSKTEVEEIRFSSCTYAGGIQLTGTKTGTKKIDIYDASVDINGFEELDELSYSGMKRESLEIKGLKKVNKRFVVTLQDVKESFSMPDLEEVAGNFFINVGKIKTVSFPKLAKVGEELTFDIQSYNVFDFVLPALQEVEGDLVLNTGYSSYYGLRSFSFPKLTTIGGKLRIIPVGNVTLENETIKSLEGLSALKSVGDGVEIKSQTILESYEPLKNILPSLTNENWDALYNGYNPSYKDLTNGKWNK